MATDKSKARTLAGNPDAVPTQLGWVNHKTGELLVSVRGLTNAYNWDRKGNTFTRGGVAADFGGRARPTAPQGKATPAGDTEAARIETPSPAAVKSADKVEETKIVDPAIEKKATEEAKPATKKTTKRVKKAPASKE